MIEIIKESKNDYNEVYNLVKSAFETAEHSDKTEHILVGNLRNSNEFIEDLSLVAKDGKKIAGHIMFTKIKINDREEIALAPLSVLPEYQNRGIGSLLIKKGHEIAKSLGYEFCVVLGDDKYYTKFGYKPASEFNISAPFDVPSENFMAINLFNRDTKLNGEVIYSKEIFSK